MASNNSISLQSKLLFSCSLLSLSLTLFLLHSPSSLPTRCTNHESQPSDHAMSSWPLFSYPSSYGEHKHALPTQHSSCNQYISFSDYGVVFREIHDLMKNSSTYEEGKELRYSEKKIMGDDHQNEKNTFAGNFSTKERRELFEYDRRNYSVEIPCGFFKEFKVTQEDRLAMEQCNGVVVVSAVFHNHDKIRQPRGLAQKSLQTVCFFMFVDDQTLQGLSSHGINLNSTRDNRIGVWRVVRVLHELPYESPAMNGVIPKHLSHRIFPNARFSIWIDAKLQLTVDPLLLLHSLVVSEDVDMGISKHPFNVHTMEEAIATARWKKWSDVQSLREQMETYCENGLEPWSLKKLPYTTDVPDTALILRRHSVASNRFSCLLFNELEAYNHRDQLCFAYIRDLMKPQIKINMFEVQVFEQIAVEYRHNIKEREVSHETMTTKMANTDDVYRSKCKSYLEKMWADTSDL